MDLRSSRRGLFGLALVALLGLTSFPALAAQTGEIQGYVVDDAGLPVAGARIILSSPQMIGGERFEQTDAEGRFRFLQLDPGIYTVLISHQKFRGFREEGIQLGLDATVIRDYLLEPATDLSKEGDDVVRVVASAPMVDTTRTRAGLSIRPEFTDRTVTSRDYQGVALFTPGVVGGSQAPGNPSIHGGSAFSNVYLLDGLNITDPVTQTFSTNFNFDSIGELEVITGGMDAEYGSTMGGVINILTKSGGDEFTLDGSIYWAPKELQLLDPGEVNDRSSIIANLAVGGPIIRKKLWFFVSGQYVDSQAQTLLPPGQEPVFPDDPETPDVDESRIPLRRFNAFYGLGKLKWQPLPWQKVTLLLQSDPTVISNLKQSPSVHPAAERQQSQGGVKIIGTSETTLSENLFWKTMVGYAGDPIIVGPQSGDEKTPGRSNQSTGTQTANDTLLSEDWRYRLIAQTHLSYFLEGLLGDHEIKAGLEGSILWNTDENRNTGNPGACLGYQGGCSYLDDGIEEPGSRIDGVGDPHRVTVYDDAFTRTVRSNLVSVFLQDAWRPFRSLTIRPGLRFDSSRGYNDVGDGEDKIFDFNSLSPRFGVAWDPFGDGKTVVRGGYYYYAETGLLSAPGFVGRSRTFSTFQYNAATEQYDILVQRGGGDNGVIYKEGMQPPRMHEVLFGVQRQLFDDAAVAVDFTYRHRSHHFEDDEANVLWNREGNRAVGFLSDDPTFIFSLGTPEEAMAQYIGMDLIFEKRLSDNWQALVTYTLSKLEGTVERNISYSFDNPRQRPFEYGFLEDDVRHRARVTLSYDLPFGFQVGGTGIYQSGRPRSKFFFNEVYGDYLDRRAARGYDPGDLDDKEDDVELRLPDTFFVNMRFAWRLKELTTQDIWLIADVANIFNSRPTTEIEQRDLPPGSATQFGQPIDRGNPLSVELAVRYIF